MIASYKLSIEWPHQSSSQKFVSRGQCNLKCKTNGMTGVMFPLRNDPFSPLVILSCKDYDCRSRGSIFSVLHNFIVWPMLIKIMSILSEE